MTTAKWTHLFPCRTQKLSTLALTIVLTSENRTLPTPFYNLLNLFDKLKKYDIISTNGGLAQLGEHLPYKQRVGGSSPSSSTI